MPQVSRHERFREIHTIAEELLRGDKSLGKDYSRFETVLLKRLKERKMAINPFIKLVVKLVLQAILAAL